MPGKKKPKVIITPDYLLKGKLKREYRGNSEVVVYKDWRFIRLKSLEELKNLVKKGPEGKNEVIEYLRPYVEQYSDIQIAEMMQDANWSQVRTFRQSLGLKKKSRGVGLYKVDKYNKDSILDNITNEEVDNIGMIYRVSGIMDANMVLQRIEPITAILTNCPGKYKVNISIIEIISNDENTG